MFDNFVQNRQSLRTELRCAGLFPSLEKIPYLHALIRQRGEIEMAWLREEVGVDLWDEEIQMVASKNPERSILWTLGHGSFLAEFAAAPLGLNAESMYRAARLGARVNLIVSLYDNFLDQGYKPVEILQNDFAPGSRLRLVSSLIKGYFRYLENPVPLLKRAIDVMYKAENESTIPLIERVWRRKCALPFVVMGIGAWGLGKPQGQLAHLSWLYRTGLLIGWVDDAVDAEKDALTGRPNRFYGAGTPQRIAVLGHRVLEWWDRHAFAPDCRNAFLYCVYSWITPRTS